MTLLSSIVNAWTEATWPTRRDSATDRTESAVSRGTKVHESNQNDPLSAESKDISRSSRVAASAAPGSGRDRQGRALILGPIDIRTDRQSPPPFVMPASCRHPPQPFTARRMRNP